MPRPYHVDLIAGARKESPQLHAREIQKVDVVRRKGCLAAIDEHQITARDAVEVPCSFDYQQGLMRGFRKPQLFLQQMTAERDPVPPENLVRGDGVR